MQALLSWISTLLERTRTKLWRVDGIGSFTARTQTEGGWGLVDNDVLFIGAHHGLWRPRQCHGGYISSRAFGYSVVAGVDEAIIFRFSDHQERKDTFSIHWCTQQRILAWALASWTPEWKVDINDMFSRNSQSGCPHAYRASIPSWQPLARLATSRWFCGNFGATVS